MNVLNVQILNTMILKLRCVSIIHPVLKEQIGINKSCNANVSSEVNIWSTEPANNAELIKAGMENSVFVDQVIISSEIPRNASHVTYIPFTIKQSDNVFAIEASMEME